MQSDVLIKAELDKLIKDTAARAKEHHVSISFEYHGVKYTIAPIGVANYGALR